MSAVVCTRKTGDLTAHTYDIYKKWTGSNEWMKQKFSYHKRIGRRLVHQDYLAADTLLVCRCLRKRLYWASTWPVTLRSWYHNVHRESEEEAGMEMRKVDRREDNNIIVHKECIQSQEKVTAPTWYYHPSSRWGVVEGASWFWVPRKDQFTFTDQLFWKTKTFPKAPVIFLPTDTTTVEEAVP